jgi:hypothetical protein
MAYAPIQLISVPIENYDGWWLKFYAQGTTTPLSMATDSTGGTLIVKAEISSGGTVPAGFLKTSGNALLNPHMNAAYDAWLFPTAAEADANDTTNAIQLADNITADPASSVTIPGYTVTDKAAAVLITPVAGKTMFVESSDGGLFKAVTGAALLTYSDDGGSYCGTQFIPTGGDGSTAWVRDYEGEIYATWFGVVADGITNDSAALQAAIDAMSTLGGGSINCHGLTMLIGTNIAMKAGVSIVGDMLHPYGWKGDSVWGTKFIVTASVGFSFVAGCGIEGVAIIKSGVTYPETQAQVAAWTGTAIDGSGAGSVVRNCMIAGFQYGITLGTSLLSIGRTLLENVFLDCRNGVILENGVDVDRLNGVHCWPFMSNAVTTDEDIERVGTGIKLISNGAWTRVENCFVFGYTKGFWANGTTHTSFDNCATDYHSQIANVSPRGIVIDGDAYNTTIDNCDIGGKNDIGIDINLSTLTTVSTVQINNTRLTSEIAAHCINIESARGVIVDGSILRSGGSASGIRIAADMGLDLTISATRFNNLSNVINNSAAGYTTNTIRWSPDNTVINTGTNYWNNAIDTSSTVASATVVDLPLSSDYITVTGTTTIASLKAAFPNRTVILDIVTGLTINHLGGNINLITGANTTYAAGKRVTFICQGSVWYETNVT